MKKIAYLYFVLTLVFVLVGCERAPKVISFQNATMAGSDSNTVKIFIAKDKLYESKSYDIWVKSDKPITLTLNYENQESFIVNFEKEDYWYSLTNLEFESKNLKNQENYKSFKEALNQTLILKTNEECNITFKGVVGDKCENAEKTGFIFANAEDVSVEYMQKLIPQKV